MARHTVDPYCADDRIVDVTGLDEVTLPVACSSIIITFGTAQNGYDLSLNTAEDFGDGTALFRVKHFAASQAITISNYKVRSITVRAAAGATWGYIGFVSPRTGMALSVER